MIQQLFNRKVFLKKEFFEEVKLLRNYFTGGQK